MRTALVAIALVLSIGAMAFGQNPPVKAAALCDCGTFCVTPLTAGQCGRCAPAIQASCKGKPRPVAKPPRVGR